MAEIHAVIFDVDGTLVDSNDVHARAWQEASSKDAQKSKPDSDVVKVALERSGYGPEEVLMVGDTVYDIESAAKLGIRTIVFCSGGWKDQDLKGALAIYDGPADLLEQYDYSPLGKSV